MMKTYILIFIGIIACSFVLAQEKYVLVIHGGAGNIEKTKMPEEVQKKYEHALNYALETGDSVLKNGGTCMDAVEQTIMMMEDCPLFNAGQGAVFTNKGTNELDASIMNGSDLNAGAVAGVTDIKNPIRAARMVMEESKHVMFGGKGASVFARQQGLKIVDSSYFYTEERYKSLQKAIEKEKVEKHGTVGCVALDQYGNLAAGTSTGGMTNKKFGRIGDSPIIGAGTYASNQTCAISCTGHGEYYIRLGFARDISAMMEYQHKTVEEACRCEIEKLSRLNGTGGVIALDKNGNIAMDFNTSGMFRGFIKSSGEKEVAMFDDEE